MTVPSILEELYQLQSDAGIAALQNLSFVAVGGAPMKHTVASALAAAHVPLLNHGAAERVHALAPGGVDLLLDLVGGGPLRDLAPLVVSPDHVVSAADPGTAEELGGSGRANDPRALEELVRLVASGAVGSTVSAVHPLERAGQALAAVAKGHGTGKTVVVP